MPTIKRKAAEQVRATHVHFIDNMLAVSLSDGRKLSIPMEQVEWLQWLLNATPEQRGKWSLEPGGFAIYWEIMALSIPKDKAGPVAIIFPLFGIPFVIVGLYLIFGRFIVDSNQRKKTFYGLTNQRIIIISGVFSRKVESLNLKTLTNISLKEKSDRSGTINFGQNNPLSWWFGGMAWPGMPKSGPSLEMIEGAKEVYEKIREAQGLK